MFISEHRVNIKKPCQLSEMIRSSVSDLVFIYTFSMSYASFWRDIAKRSNIMSDHKIEVTN